jgi:hypothetical protein
MITKHTASTSVSPIWSAATVCPRPASTRSATRHRVYCPAEATPLQVHRAAADGWPVFVLRDDGCADFIGVGANGRIRSRQERATRHVLAEVPLPWQGRRLPSPLREPEDRPLRLRTRLCRGVSHTAQRIPMPPLPMPPPAGRRICGSVRFLTACRRVTPPAGSVMVWRGRIR